MSVGKGETGVVSRFNCAHVPIYADKNSRKTYRTVKKNSYDIEHYEEQMHKIRHAHAVPK